VTKLGPGTLATDGVSTEMDGRELVAAGVLADDADWSDGDLLDPAELAIAAAGGR
jgi:hypothetical protein